MKRNKILLRLLSIALMVAMMLSTFASCASDESENQPTEAPTAAPTEAPTEAPTQPAHVHEWSEWSVRKEATCAVAGEKVRTCECGEEETEVIPETEKHHWENGVCTECNTDHNHLWSNWEKVSDSTCAHGGDEMRKCSVCLFEQHRFTAPTGVHGELVDGVCPVCNNRVLLLGADHLQSKIPSDFDPTASVVAFDFKESKYGVTALKNNARTLISDREKLKEMGLTADQISMTAPVDLKRHGEYEVFLTAILPDGAAGSIVMQVGNGEKVLLQYNVAGDFLSKYRDEHSVTLIRTGLICEMPSGTAEVKFFINDSVQTPISICSVMVIKQIPQVGKFFVQSDFHATLPEQFNGSDAILIPAESCEIGSNLEMVKLDSQYLLTSKPEMTDFGANCVVKLKAGGLYHYYIDVSQFKNASGMAPSRYSAFIKWSFEVPADGWYDVCFNFRLKDIKMRYTQLSLDGVGVKDSWLLGYECEDAALIRDDKMNTYMTGWRIYLTAGKHTLMAQQPDEDATISTYRKGMGMPWHYRNIYLAPAVEEVDTRAKLPKLEGSSLFDGNQNGSYTLALNNTTLDVFNAYCAKLVEEGYTLQNERIVDTGYFDFDTEHYQSDAPDFQNIYRTYTDDRSMVYAYLTGAKHDMRVVCADISEYNAMQTQKQYEETHDAGTGDSFFAMLDIGGQNSLYPTTVFAQGMCLVFKLSDGRFLVFDGGQVEESGKTDVEVQRLHDWMKANSDDGNIVIACWMFTHDHSDHVNIAWLFEKAAAFGLDLMLEKNKTTSVKYDDVVIQNYMFNFPDQLGYILPNTAKSDLNLSYYAVRYPRIKQMLSRHNSLIARTGMVYNFANATVEIMYANDDFFPAPFTIFNNSSTVFKVTIGGKTFLVTGDLQEEGQLSAVSKQGKLLDVDFVQATHHGYNGLKLFYQYGVGLDNTTVALWPMPGEGTIRDLEANAWLMENAAENVICYELKLPNKTYTYGVSNGTGAYVVSFPAER